MARLTNLDPFRKFVASQFFMRTRAEFCPQIHSLPKDTVNFGHAMEV